MHSAFRWPLNLGGVTWDDKGAPVASSHVAHRKLIKSNLDSTRAGSMKIRKLDDMHQAAAPCCTGTASMARRRRRSAISSA